MDILPHGIIARLRNGKNLVDYDWVWVWSIDTISIADTRLGTEYISVCFDDVFLADVPMRKGVFFRILADSVRVGAWKKYILI